MGWNRPYSMEKYPDEMTVEELLLNVVLPQMEELQTILMNLENQETRREQIMSEILDKLDKLEAAIDADNAADQKMFDELIKVRDDAIAARDKALADDQADKDQIIALVTEASKVSDKVDAILEKYPDLAEPPAPVEDIPVANEPMVPVEDVPVANAPVVIEQPSVVSEVPVEEAPDAAEEPEVPAVELPGEPVAILEPAVEESVAAPLPEPTAPQVLISPVIPRA